MFWGSARRAARLLALVAGGLFSSVVAADSADSSLDRLIGQARFNDARALLDEPARPDQPVSANRLARQGAVALGEGDPRTALSLLEQALLADRSLDPSLLAAVHNDVGRANMALDDPIAASAAFAKAVELASDQSPRKQRFQLNLARSLVARGRVGRAQRLVDLAESSLGNEATRATVEKRIALGAFYRDAWQETEDRAYAKQALKHWLGAAEQASKISAPRLRSYGLGLAGELYEAFGQHVDSLAAARKASFAAQEVQASEAAYRWEWLTARNHQALGNSDAAVVAYRRAVAALQEVRPALEVQPRFFRDVLGPLYHDYADALLLVAEAGDQPLLQETRDTIEALKFAEVEDYFGDQCLVSSGIASDVQSIDPGAIVLYPVVLHDRVALLVSDAAGITEHHAAVGREELEGLARRLRASLQSNAAGNSSREAAQALYKVLVEPIEGVLAERQPTTIVWVPDGVLRTVPLAALHDGESYLIERYAISTSAGMTLTDPKPIGESEPELFAGGVSAAVQGFKALPGVDEELNALSQRFGTNVYRNQAFSAELVQQNLRSGGYNIVHLATHGEFRTSYEDSFLLTYGEKLTIDKLGESIQSRSLQSGPLELIVMSACETAAGDDRAALGLAGLALRAGARSALATLWAVDDAASSLLIQEFYKALNENGYSKSESLRAAQLALVARPEFSDPSNWAPFLLIGNWL